MTTVVTSATQTADTDELVVKGYDDELGEVSATGWVSATTNHYPSSAYGTDGHLVKGAKPAEMIDTEKQAYYLQLLTGVVEADPNSTSTPDVVLYEAPPDVLATVEQKIADTAAVDAAPVDATPTDQLATPVKA